MERVLRNTQSEIRVELFQDGEAVDADSNPTVTITRDSDGSEVVADAATDKVAATTGVYSYSLSPVHTSTLDVLTANWTATIDGVADQVFTTEVEVIGGFLVSLSAIDTAADGDFTVEQLSEARRWAEDVLEDACGAFRPRYAKEYLRGYPSGISILLSKRRPIRLISGTVSDTALTEDEIGDVTVEPSGILMRAGGWGTSATLVYEHGYRSVPAPVQRAALKLAAYYLTEDPSDYFDRATSMSTEDGATYSLVTPGVRGAVTPIPEVNQVIAEYSPTVGVG